MIFYYILDINEPFQNYLKYLNIVYFKLWLSVKKYEKSFFLIY